VVGVSVDVAIDVSVDVAPPVAGMTSPQLIVDRVANAPPPPAIPAAASALNRNKPARLSPRGGGRARGLPRSYRDTSRRRRGSEVP
jgi:hypothetical protein